jgi:membrane protease YdiL (CAAX protease family)
MPDSIDLVLVALLVTFDCVVWLFLIWPRVRPLMASGAAHARSRGYRVMIALQWLGTVLVLARWVNAHRSWTDLGLVLPTGWRVAAGAAPIVALGWLWFRQARAIAALSSEKRAAARKRFSSVSVMVPHTADEHRWFMLLSVTAGICEELFYRGFLVWAFRPWLGLFGAAGLSLLFFGLGHAYLGRSGVVRATIVGAVLGALALLTGSIVPSIVLHAMFDLCSGGSGYALLREEEVRPELRHAGGT